MLAIEYRWRGGHLLTLHNLSADNVTVRLPTDLGAEEGDAEPRGPGAGDAKILQVLGDEPPPAGPGQEPPAGPGQEMTLGRYGFRWLRLAAGAPSAERAKRPGRRRAWLSSLSRGKLGSMTQPQEDAACEVAHGHGPTPGADRTLIAAFVSPVAEYLVRYASDAGFRVVLVEPDMAWAGAKWARGYPVTGEIADHLDETADVVVTDHHRPELGAVLRDALDSKARWVGIMGNPRHPAPHIPALRELGVAEADIARVHRPIGLNIGSRTPPEIAIATLAGLIADRNGRPGGFSF